MPVLNLEEAINFIRDAMGRRDARQFLESQEGRQAFASPGGLQTVQPGTNRYIQEAVANRMRQFLGEAGRQLTGAQTGLTAAQGEGVRQETAQRGADFSTFGGITPGAARTREDIAASQQGRSLLDQQRAFLEQRGFGPTATTAEATLESGRQGLLERQLTETEAAGQATREQDAAVRQYLESQGYAPTPEAMQAISQRMALTQAGDQAQQETLLAAMSALPSFMSVAGMDFDDTTTAARGALDVAGQAGGPVGDVFGGAGRALSESETQQRTLVKKILGEDQAAAPGTAPGAAPAVNPYRDPRVLRALETARATERSGLPGTSIPQGPAAPSFGFTFGAAPPTQPSRAPLTLNSPEDIVQLQGVLAEQQRAIQSQLAQLSATPTAEAFAQRQQAQQRLREVNIAMENLQLIMNMIQEATRNFEFLSRPQ